MICSKKYIIPQDLIKLLPINIVTVPRASKRFQNNNSLVLADVSFQMFYERIDGLLTGFFDHGTVHRRSDVVRDGSVPKIKIKLSVQEIN